MAEWTNIAIPLSGGLDTKTSAQVVLPTKMTVLENAEFTKGGSVKKRPGYTSVALETVAGIAIDNALGLATRTDELLVLTRDNLYTFDTTTDSFQDAGEYCPMTWKATDVVNSVASQTRGDVATNGGITVYAWQDSRGGVRYAVHDDTTGAALAADSSLASANASQPKVTAVGDVIFITYVDTSANNIKYKLIRPGAVAASLAAAVGDLVEDYSANSDYDIVGGDAQGWVLYEDSATVKLVLRSFTVAGATINTVDVDPDDIERPLALGYNANTGKLLVAYAETSSGDTTVLEYTGSTLTVTGVSITITQSNTLIGMAVTALDDGGIMVWSTADNSSAYTTSWAYRDSAGTTTTGSVLKGVVCSSAWTVGNTGYVILAYDSPTGLQDSYFIYRHDGVLVGRLLYGEGNGAIRASATCYGPRVSALSDGRYQCVLEYRRSLATDAGDTKDLVPINSQFQNPGLRRIILDSEPTPSTTEINGTAYMSGSMLWAYDGGPHPVEANLLLWPEISATSVVQSGTAGGGDIVDIVSGVTYNYRVYAEATLTNGQVVRSAAITRSVTTTSTNKIVITIPCIPFTRHLGDRPNISFVVYRSEADKADLYYRASNPDPTVSGDNGYVANDPTAASVTFTDDGDVNTSGVLTVNELDYPSARGELMHFAPEGTTYLGAAQSRLFLVGGGTKPNNVLPSLLHFDGEPVHFNDDLVVAETPKYGGDVIGVAPLNDIIAVFKERAIFAVAGNGPDNTGGATGAFESRAITSDLGCSDPGTIVPCPVGVMFKSAKGFQLLASDFSVTYVGADVEAYNSTTFLAGAAIPNSNQVIFISEDGTGLLFDWFFKSWSVLTGHAGLATCVWKEDTFVYLRTDGRVFFRDPDVYTDGGSGYALKIRTAPIRVENTVQGFWLLKHFNVLGDYRSLHRLRVALYYDRDEAPFESFTVTPANFVETETYGDDAEYGDADYYGGDIASSEYQFQIKPKRSKTQTIRFEFTDIPGTNPGASYEITELNLEVGLKPGNAKLTAARKV